jgi:hypothetical protein
MFPDGSVTGYFDTLFLNLSHPQANAEMDTSFKLLLSDSHEALPSHAHQNATLFPGGSKIAAQKYSCYFYNSLLI